MIDLFYQKAAVFMEERKHQKIPVPGCLKIKDEMPGLRLQTV
jgi:hypothetical protein